MTFIPTRVPVKVDYQGTIRQACRAFCKTFPLCLSHERSLPRRRKRYVDDIKPNGPIECLCRQFLQAFCRIKINFSRNEPLGFNKSTVWADHWL